MALGMDHPVFLPATVVDASTSGCRIVVRTRANADGTMPAMPQGGRYLLFHPEFPKSPHLENAVRVQVKTVTREGETVALGAKYDPTQPMVVRETVAHMIFGDSASWETIRARRNRKMGLLRGMIYVLGPVVQGIWHTMRAMADRARASGNGKKRARPMWWWWKSPRICWPLARPSIRPQPNARCHCCRLRSPRTRAARAEVQVPPVGGSAGGNGDAPWSHTCLAVGAGSGAGDRPASAGAIRAILHRLDPHWRPTATGLSTMSSSGSSERRARSMPSVTAATLSRSWRQKPASSAPCARSRRGAVRPARPSALTASAGRCNSRCSCPILRRCMLCAFPPCRRSTSCPSARPIGSLSTTPSSAKGGWTISRTSARSIFRSVRRWSCPVRTMCASNWCSITASIAAPMPRSRCGRTSISAIRARC